MPLARSLSSGKSDHPDSKPMLNPLKELATLGQSLWLDYIRRDLITSGELRRLMEEDGLRGMRFVTRAGESAKRGSVWVKVSQHP